MINTEHIIKRKVVPHDVYIGDSDEDCENEADRNGYLRQQQRARQRRKRQYDPKYYENDSDFESSSDEKAANNDLKQFGKQLHQQSFDKIDIFNKNKNKNNKKNNGVSGLSMLIQSSAPVFNSSHIGRMHSKSRKGRSLRGDDDELEQNFSKYARYEPESEYMRQQNGTFILTVYFGEYLCEEPIQLSIIEAWSVSETIFRCIEKWKIERPLRKLKGTVASDYLMRGVEIEMDGIVEIEEDVPAFGRHLKIHTLNEKYVGLQYIIKNVGSQSQSAENKVIAFKNAAQQILVRVSIPGPNNESHVLAIDKDATALTIRDLISLLNKKKHGAHFHAQYFNFYFNKKCKAKDTLSLAKCIIDLAEPRQLILLPKFLSKNDDINEAYNFNLVRLANETREYHCTKIRNARKNKKRLLIVDRHRIVKKAMDDYNIGTNDHVPIDITSIIELHISDKDNKQFNIKYRKPQHAGTRQQLYELENEKECKHFVNKVKYLRTLRKLQGL